MELSEVIGIEKPDPDSQFRLRTCAQCSGDDVAYALCREFGGEKWRVRCFGCGHTLDKGYELKHDAQNAWNQEVRNG